MVRPVPTIKIDFGNGHVLTRTLHGNIATYLCNADGNVLDILPGIYDPHAYAEALDQFSLLANYARREDIVYYHQHMYSIFSMNKSRPLLVQSSELPKDVGKQRLDVSKMTIESPLKTVLRTASVSTPVAPGGVAVTNEASLPEWGKLAEDTRINEHERRKLIHKKLAAVGMVRPENITKWLYKDVLHADLDDPYLGLAPYLFANYPFKDEQRY